MSRKDSAMEKNFKTAAARARYFQSLSDKSEEQIEDLKSHLASAEAERDALIEALSAYLSMRSIETILTGVRAFLNKEGKQA